MHFNKLIAVSVVLCSDNVEIHIGNTLIFHTLDLWLSNYVIHDRLTKTNIEIALYNFLFD